jgi:hypothetical protein
MTDEQRAALKKLKTLGQKLSSGTSWDVRLATRWAKDPETGNPCIVDVMTLDTGDLMALADLLVE